MSFSELLKQCRKKQGVSQAELASKLGVTQQAVGKWESGKSSPDPTTVARIAELLNTTADYLLGLYRPVSNVSAPEERFFGSYSESLIPVIGTVKAGYGALAFEEDYGQEYARVKDPSNYFYLVVRGDSMEPRIQDGDLGLEQLRRYWSSRFLCRDQLLSIRRYSLSGGIQHWIRNRLS